MLNYEQISKSAILVSADKGKIISEYYQYWLIQKFNLSVIIGQYEKMIIDCTLGDFPKKHLFSMNEFRIITYNLS